MAGSLGLGPCSKINAFPLHGKRFLYYRALWLHPPERSKKRCYTSHPRRETVSQSQEAHIFLPHHHYHTAVIVSNAATRQSLTLHLLPEPTSTLSHLLACRWISFQGRKYFLLDAMQQLPCLPAPGKCPNVSGSKQQLRQTARVFSVCSRGCHLPWLLQCGPQWFYKKAKERERGVKKLTDFYSLTVGGKIQVTVSQDRQTPHLAVPSPFSFPPEFSTGGSPQAPELFLDAHF